VGQTATLSMKKKLFWC